MRSASISRKTNETDIKLTLNLDGKGVSEVSTGSGFLDHMLTLFSKHSGFDLQVKCKGDTNVDMHHSTEDIAIVLGEAFCKAIGDKKGILRYTNVSLPMDEALVNLAVDISGRGFLVYNADYEQSKVGDFDTELVEEFMQSFAANARITLHINKVYGVNTHHIIEAIFKALARCLKTACSLDSKDPNSIPSTKGTLI